jgi:hypothetical protein
VYGKYVRLNVDHTLRATAGGKVRKAIVMFERVTVRILELKRTEM